MAGKHVGSGPRRAASAGHDGVTRGATGRNADPPPEQPPANRETAPIPPPAGRPGGGYLLTSVLLALSAGLLAWGVASGSWREVLRSAPLQAALVAGVAVVAVVCAAAAPELRTRFSLRLGLVPLIVGVVAALAAGVVRGAPAADLATALVPALVSLVVAVALALVLWRVPVSGRAVMAALGAGLMAVSLFGGMRLVALSGADRGAPQLAVRPAADGQQLVEARVSGLCAAERLEVVVRTVGDDAERLASAVAAPDGSGSASVHLPVSLPAGAPSVLVEGWVRPAEGDDADRYGCRRDGADEDHVEVRLRPPTAPATKATSTNPSAAAVTTTTTR